ncbi:MAG: 50S ribosomal protein L29 [Kiritimatiellae bacterium]|nr:50S ribosomal protein L29 [Kiritimatiellia bacterium]
MKAKELRDMTAEEKAQALQTAQEAYFKLRMQQATGQLEKPLQLRGARRDIARILTVINESKPVQ